MQTAVLLRTVKSVSNATMLPSQASASFAAPTSLVETCSMVPSSRTPACRQTGDPGSSVGMTWQREIAVGVPQLRTSTAMTIPRTRQCPTHTHGILKSLLLQTKVLPFFSNPFSYRVFTFFCDSKKCEPSRASKNSKSKRQLATRPY